MLINWFEKHYLFRRSMILLELIFVFWVTHLSFDYIMAATAKGVAGTDIVMVATILQGPMTALLAYSFKLYIKSREPF